MQRSRTLLHWLIVLAVLGSVAQASPLVICTEDSVSGCVAAIPTSAPPSFLASDGESFFDTFGTGIDSSDQVLLSGLWFPDPAFAAAFGPGLWTQINSNLWILPSAAHSEPFAKWYSPGTKWSSGTPDILWMLEASGSVSDVAYIRNDGPGGSAAITFGSVPEPGSLGLVLTGIAAVAISRLKRSR
jgi:hypothetical protein